MGISKSKFLFQEKTDPEIIGKQPRYYCKKCKEYFTFPSIFKHVVEAGTNIEPSPSESYFSNDATVNERASEGLMDIQPQAMKSRSGDMYTIAIQTDSWLRNTATNTSVSFKQRKKRKSLWVWWPWGLKRFKTKSKCPKVTERDIRDKASTSEEHVLKRQILSSCSKDSNKKITFNRKVSLVRFDSTENITNETNEKRSFLYALQQQKTKDLSDSSHDSVTAKSSFINKDTIKTRLKSLEILFS